MSIEFLDELPDGGGRAARNRELRQFAAALQSNPGRWAKYPVEISKTSLHTRALQIRKGALTTFPLGAFDAAVREGALYVQAKEQR